MNNGRASLIVSLLVGTVAFCAGVAFTEGTFGRLRPVQSAPLLYSVEVRDEAGELLASPLLVGDGDATRTVHLDLSAPENEGDPAPQAMSLDLDPTVSGPGVCLGFRLSLDGQGSHEGRLSLPLGESRSVDVGAAGEKLQLKFTVARAGTRAFDRLLRARKVARPLS